MPYAVPLHLKELVALTSILLVLLADASFFIAAFVATAPCSVQGLQRRAVTICSLQPIRVGLEGA